MLNQLKQTFKIEPEIIRFHDDEWIDILKQPLNERLYYKKTSEHYKYGQLVAQFLGTNLLEEQYFDQLYDLANDDQLSMHVLHQELKKDISREQLQSIYQIYLLHQDEQFSPRRLVSFLERVALIPKYHNKPLDTHIRTSFVKTLEAFHSKHNNNLDTSIFRRVLTDLIKWNWNHFDPLLRNTTLDEEVPRLLWYGDMNESQRYYVYFLMNIGWDILIFQPNGIDSFLMFRTKETEAFIQTNPKKIENKPFPINRSQRTTVAYKASKQLDKILHHDQSDLYKPWQFKNHLAYSIPLKTTYDEIFLLLKEPAFIRPNFQIKDNKVYIPVLFAKIAGILNDRDEYWEHLNQITEEDELTLFIKNFPFASTRRVNSTYYNDSLGRNGKLDPQKIISNVDWKYKHLPIGLQTAIASAITRYSENPLLTKLEHETNNDLKQYLFSQAISLPNKIIRLLQGFDYTQRIPRVVLYHTENNGKITRADAALLLFLHEFGVDILIFNPSGQNDLEFFINETNLDKHWLAEMGFNQEFKEINIFQRLSNNIFKVWKE